MFFPLCSSLITQAKFGASGHLKVLPWVPGTCLEVNNQPATKEAPFVFRTHTTKAFNHLVFVFPLGNTTLGFQNQNVLPQTNLGRVNGMGVNVGTKWNSNVPGLPLFLFGFGIILPTPEEPLNPAFPKFHVDQPR